MNTTVYTKSFSPPPFNRREILRYAMVKDADKETEKLLDSCLNEIEKKLTYKVCFAHFPLSVCDNCIDLSFTSVSSSALKRNLEGCSSFVLFAATIGIELDRLISRYGRISPSKALMLQAIGTERIESLCDVFNKEINSEVAKCGKSTVQRFSPGYGDLPIDIQKDFFRVLDPYRKIGLSLNESLLMSPSKSVTATIGISDTLKENRTISSCSLCQKADCIFRRTL